MTTPLIAAPVMAQAMAANGLRVALQAGASYGLGIEIAGASTLAMSASTVILATGGAAALVFAGYGLYQYLNKH